MIFFCKTQKETCYAGLFHAINANGDWDCQIPKNHIKEDHSYKVAKNIHKRDIHNTNLLKTFI